MQISSKDCRWKCPETFKNQSGKLKLFIIPSITQRLILGIDFWKTFGLFPDIRGSVDLLVSDKASNKLPKLSAINKTCKIGQHLEQLENDRFPLSEQQSIQLKTVIDMFPNFETQGLGRTTLR